MDRELSQICLEFILKIIFKLKKKNEQNQLDCIDTIK